MTGTKLEAGRAAFAAAGLGAQGSVRAAPRGDQFDPSAPAAVLAPWIHQGGAGIEARPSPALHAWLRCQPRGRQHLPGQRRWTQAPSGAGYALADRRIVANALPDVYERVGPRPISPFAQAFAPRPDRCGARNIRGPGSGGLGARESTPKQLSTKPIWRRSSAFRWWRAQIWWFATASCGCGRWAPSKGWMWCSGGSTPSMPIHLTCARFPAQVVGLVEAQRRGAVSVVNTFGSGILESPGFTTISAADRRAAVRREAPVDDTRTLLGRDRQGVVAHPGEPPRC